MKKITPTADPAKFPASRRISVYPVSPSATAAADRSRLIFPVALLILGTALGCSTGCVAAGAALLLVQAGAFSATPTDFAARSLESDLRQNLPPAASATTSKAAQLRIKGPEPMEITAIGDFTTSSASGFIDRAKQVAWWNRVAMKIVVYSDRGGGRTELARDELDPVEQIKTELWPLLPPPANSGTSAANRLQVNPQFCQIDAEGDFSASSADVFVDACRKFQPALPRLHVNLYRDGATRFSRKIVKVYDSDYPRLNFP